MSVWKIDLEKNIFCSAYSEAEKIVLLLLLVYHKKDKKSNRYLGEFLKKMQTFFPSKASKAM